MDKMVIIRSKGESLFAHLDWQNSDSNIKSKVPVALTDIWMPAVLGPIHACIPLTEFCMYALITGVRTRMFSYTPS